MEATQRLLQRCQEELKDHGTNLYETRRFHGQPFQNRGQNQYRVMKWNILGDKSSGYTEALTNQENILACPRECLPWPYRRWQVLEEIATYNPDIITLVELDKGEDLLTDLSPLGYELILVKKDFWKNNVEILNVQPKVTDNQESHLLCDIKDTAQGSVIEIDNCVTLEEKTKSNNGSGIFWKTSKFDIIDQEILEASVEKTGKPGSTLRQVCNIVALKPRDGGTAFVICCLHLEPTKWQEGENIRISQMDEVMQLLNRRFIGKYPVMICADSKGSLVPMTDKDCKEIKPMAVNVAVDSALMSTYVQDLAEDPNWTSWKTRAGKKFKYTIDHILVSDNFVPKAVLGFVPEEMVPENHFPNRSARDHRSLICDFEVVPMTSIREHQKLNKTVRDHAFLGAATLSVITVMAIGIWLMI